MLKKMLLVIVIALLIVFVSACSNVNRGSVSEAHLYRDGEVIFTFTNEEHSDEIKILVKMVNKARKQVGMIDMPKSDYQLEFVLDDGKTSGFSLWFFQDSSTILENSTSDYVELSSSNTKKLNQVVTEFDASGIKHVNFYYLVMGIPVLIVIPMLFDIVGRKKKVR